MPNAIDTKTVELGDTPSIRIRCLKRVGTGDRILCIPGIPCELEVWPNLINALDDTADVTVVERPGYGESLVDGRDPTFADQLEAIAHFIPAADEQPVYIIGHSFGTVLALNTALELPERIKGLLLVSGPPDPDQLPGFALAVGGMMSAMPLLPSKQASVLREAAEVPDRLRELNQRLSNFSLPVGFVHGSRDFIVPAPHSDHRRRLLMQASSTEPVILQGGDHVIVENRASDVAACFRALRARVDGA